MYRDDSCAVCGESLPPDHFYCREHAAGVDDRLHEVGVLLHRVGDDLPRLVELLAAVAPETWDYLADVAGDEPTWPPQVTVRLRLQGDDVDVDVDPETGGVRVTLAAALPELLGAVSRGLAGADAARLAAACRVAEGANASH